MPPQDHSIPEILGGSYFWRSINHMDREVTARSEFTCGKRYQE
jgi:hypothetical protein